MRLAWDYDKLALALPKDKYRKEFNGVLEFYLGKHQDKPKKAVGDNAEDELGELLANFMQQKRQHEARRQHPEERSYEAWQRRVQAE
eukprot:5075311-Pyramimonas_sp.AAC.1